MLTNQVTAPPTSDQQLSTEESPILPAAASQRTDSPPYPVSPEQNTDALQDGGPTPDATPKPHKGRCFPGGLMGGLTGALVGGLIGALPPPIPPFGPIGPPVGPGPFLPPGPVGPGMFFPPGPAGPGPWWPNPPMAFYPNGPVPFFPFGAYSAGGPSRRGHAAFESFNGDAANRPVQPPSNNSPQEGEKNLNGPAKRLEHEPDQAEKGAAFSKDDPVRRSKRCVAPVVPGAGLVAPVVRPGVAVPGVVAPGLVRTGVFVPGRRRFNRRLRVVG